jgi:phytoene synthase
VAIARPARGQKQPGSLDAAYEYCRDVTRREAKNFYYGFSLLPDDRRRAIYAAYAFARKADDIVDSGLPPTEAAERLNAYQAALQCCLEGTPDGPVFRALFHAVSKYDIPAQHLYALLDGCRTDLSRNRYETFDDLRSYCGQVASSVGLISIAIFGYRGGERARQHAADLGIGLQLTNILRDVREDAGRGRIYLPAEEMDWFGFREADLLGGRTTREFRRFMAYQTDRAREYFRQGRRLLPLLPTRARACVGVMAGIYEAILDDIERDPGVIFRQRVGLSATHKLALAGRELVRTVTA